jgi:hypothetical protein
MKTKLIIVLSLICSISFGQQVISISGSSSTSSDASWAADSANVLHWADTTGAVGGIASYSDLLEVSGVDAATVSGIVHDTVVNYVKQTALVDSAFVVAGDLSTYVTQSALVDSAFTVAGDLTSFQTAANVSSIVHDSLAAFTIGANEVASVDTIFGMDDGVFSAIPLNTNDINLKTDTIPIFVFGLGSGLAADTASFTNNAIAGSFYNAGSDTIHVTALRGVLAEGSGTETVAVQVSWHATFKSGSATNLNESAYTVTSITTGDNDTSFANAVIPPGVFVWCTISGVSAGNKPSLLILTLSGYKVPTY